MAIMSDHERFEGESRSRLPFYDICLMWYCLRCHLKPQCLFHNSSESESENLVMCECVCLSATVARGI